MGLELRQEYQSNLASEWSWREMASFVPYKLILVLVPLGAACHFELQIILGGQPIVPKTVLGSHFGW